MSTNEDLCPICRNNDHKSPHNHALQRFGKISPSLPRSFVVKTRNVCRDPFAVAETLAIARQELRDYFPGRKFEFQPVEMMLVPTSDRDAMSELFVTAYAVFEIQDAY